MGLDFVQKLKQKILRKESVGRQIDLIEEQYDWLIRDFAEVKRQFQDIRYRKLQLQKQIENLREVLREEEGDG